MTKKTEKYAANDKPTRKKKGDGAVSTATPSKTVRDKGTEAMKKAMTPVPLPASEHTAEIIPINAGGPALAAAAAPAAVAITEVTRQWSDAKRMEAQGKREAEIKRKEIIAHPDFGGDIEKVIGYSNSFVDIRPDTEVAWDSPALATFLKEKGWFESLCKPPVLDPEKVKSKALTEPELEAKIKELTTRKPKFFQVKDTAEDKAK